MWSGAHELSMHFDVIKWKHFRFLALCAGNSPVAVTSPHKGQWRGTLMFSLIYAWINDWVNNRDAGDLRRQRGHYDVIVMENLEIASLYHCCQHKYVHGYHHLICWEIMFTLERQYDKICIWICRGIIYKNNNDVYDHNNGNKNSNNNNDTYNKRWKWWQW